MNECMHHCLLAAHSSLFFFYLFAIFFYHFLQHCHKNFIAFIWISPSFAGFYVFFSHNINVSNAFLNRYAPAKSSFDGSILSSAAACSDVVIFRFYFATELTPLIANRNATDEHFT